MIIQLDKATKKKAGSELASIVGRVGIVNTLSLLAKYMQPKALKYPYDDHDMKLFKVLADHAQVLRKAKKRSKKLCEDFNNEEGN